MVRHCGCSNAWWLLSVICNNSCSRVQGMLVCYQTQPPLKCTQSFLETRILCEFLLDTSVVARNIYNIRVCDRKEHEHSDHLHPEIFFPHRFPSHRRSSFSTGDHHSIESHYLCSNERAVLQNEDTSQILKGNTKHYKFYHLSLLIRSTAITTVTVIIIHLMKMWWLLEIMSLMNIHRDKI